MANVEKRQTFLMRWILFYTFVVIFVVIVAGTIATVFFDFGSPSPEERSILFKVFLGEIGVTVITLFKALFGLRKNPAVVDDSKLLKIEGKYKYDTVHNDRKFAVSGICNVKQSGRTLIFNGEWNKVTAGKKKENVSIHWHSTWAELGLDNKVRIDYTVSHGGGYRGFAIIAPGKASSNTIVGEFHDLRDPYSYGTIKFKRI